MDGGAEGLLESVGGFGVEEGDLGGAPDAASPTPWMRNRQVVFPILGAVLDLLAVRGRHRLGFEFKRTDAPKLTRSMMVSLDTLRLARIDVVHAGSHGFRMHEKVRAVPMQELLEALKPLA